MSAKQQSTPIEITDETFDATVKDATGPVLVDFWAPWCGPCRAVAPVLEELADEYGARLTIAKLNVDDNAENAARFGVRAIPTLILFDDGQPVDTFVGIQPKSTLKAAVDAIGADTGK